MEIDYNAKNIIFNARELKYHKKIKFYLCINNSVYLYRITKHWEPDDWFLLHSISPTPPWETNQIMKSAKKVRTLTMPKAKIKKTSKKAIKKSSPKKKTDVKIPVSTTKTQSPRTRSKDNPKPRKRGVSHVNKSSKTSERTVNKQKDRRHHHELSAGEYDTFVIQAAAREKVSPEELVTVDRRKEKSPILEQPVMEQEPQSGMKQDRRQKIQRRRQIDPTTCERDYSQEEIEFMNALDEYKRNSGRMFPTCSEILEVFRNLGYAKLLHEESVEISANHESGNISITTKETGTMHRNDEPLLEMSYSQG